MASRIGEIVTETASRVPSRAWRTVSKGGRDLPCARSARRCSVLRRRPTSASSDVMACCNRATLGIFSAWGSSFQSAMAVAIDSAAVTPLARTCTL